MSVSSSSSPESREDDKADSWGCREEAGETAPQVSFDWPVGVEAAAAAPLRGSLRWVAVARS